jgi:hypothetical protein
MTTPARTPFEAFGLDAKLRQALDPIRELLHGPTRNAVFPVVGSGLSQGLISWRALLEELIALAHPDERAGMTRELDKEKYTQPGFRKGPGSIAFGVRAWARANVVRAAPDAGRRDTPSRVKVALPDETNTERRPRRCPKHTRPSGPLPSASWPKCSI